MREIFGYANMPMLIKKMKKLIYYIKKAQREQFAIGQFNFSTFEQMKGIVQAAVNLKSPIILGTSEGESKFVGLQEAVAMRDALRKKTGLPIFLNLDHGKSAGYLKEAINAGYDMVHFDGSKLPLTENIKISREVVKYAHRLRLRQGFGGQGGVIVEGEVGRIGTDSSRIYKDKFEVKEEDLTNPLEAKEYITKTKVDLLAVGVGTFHGIDLSGVSPNIKLDRLEKINEALRQAQGKPIGFVLHGGSGTPEEDIKKVIQLGIVKVNINTETRLAFSNTLRKSLQENSEEITPYKYMQSSIEAVGRVIEEKIKLFGSEGRV